MIREESIINALIIFRAQFVSLSFEHPMNFCRTDCRTWVQVIERFDEFKASSLFV